MTTPLFRQTIATPLGEMTAITSDRGIVLFDFTDSTHFERAMRGIAQYLPGSHIDNRSHPHLTRLADEIREYFSGERQAFDLPLQPLGTPFQLEVWEALQTIPYGQTLTYAEEARSIGRPKSIRAVANANGRNRLPILIPCHRVIGSDGSLTGYSSGLSRKSELLRLERSFMRPIRAEM